MADEIEESDSKTGRTDIAVVVAKGLIGAIPIVGPLAAEVVGTLIPNQRLDRIERLLKVLEIKVRDVDHEFVKARFTEPGFIDLFEESLNQASRAISEDRVQYVASLVKNGLTAGEAKSLEHKHLLSLLGQLNDVEVILLRSHAKHPNRDEEFRRRHENILARTPVTMTASREELDQAAIYESYYEHLVRLDLLRNNYRRIKRGELPEFDERTGTMKASGRQITPLGRLLLRVIDLIEEEEY